MSLFTALDAAHSVYQRVYTIDMIEELYNWRRANPSEVAAVNAECGQKNGEGEGSGAVRGRETEEGHLSLNAACQILQDWYDTMAPARGTVGRWLRLLNCDNAGYFFQRRGEPEWKDVQFTAREILNEFNGRYTLSTID